MQYPSFAEYADALRPGLAGVLADPLLARGTLHTRGPGLPIAHGGTFALTFEIVTDRGRYALRCFHKRIDAVHERYRAITRHLAGVKGPYFVACQFQPQGITTESGTYPVVRMDWVDGQSLAAFVAEHLHDANALQQLRFSLRRLARHLRENGIAHGDIQPTNIIVQRGANLRLIDYDGMFVPGLAPFWSAELGQRNFQHPDRRAQHFNADLDAFSFSVIDLALEALCKRPDLWSETASGEDAFILRAADFADPAKSALFGVLGREAGLERRARYLAAICMSPFAHVPAFEDFLAARVIPRLPVELSGSADRGRRPRYVPPHAIVVGEDFAQCCKHIGDRVELIGRVVRVTNATAPVAAGRCLRVEFGAQHHDTICLNVWHGPQSRLRAVPDDTWVGEWVSAIGLVEPVLSDQQSVEGRKQIAISITEPFQLQRLTEDEAHYRLRARARRTRRSLDGTGGVRTDPIDPVAGSVPRPAVTEPVQSGAETTRTIQSPPATAVVPVPAVAPVSAVVPVPVVTPEVAAVLPTVRDVSRPQLPSRKSQPPSSQRWAAWAASAVLAVLAAYALLVPQVDREVVTATRPAAQAGSQSGPRAVVVPDAVQPAVPPVEIELRSQQSVTAAGLTLDTVAGTLAIVPATDDPRKRVALLDGQVIPGLRDDTIVLAHRAVFSDHDIVTGFTQCTGSAAPCGLRVPFWLDLRIGVPPKLRQVPNLWVGAGGATISATNEGVGIDLGRWNGERRSARLTLAGNVVIARTAEAIRPLSRADCAVVAQSLEACAASRDCRSFARSAQRIPASQWTRLTRMYHETTGLDAEVFRVLCVRSCELGLTPSMGLVRSNACSGAKPGQWRSDDPAAGLVR